MQNLLTIANAGNWLLDLELPYDHNSTEHSGSESNSKNTETISIKILQAWQAKGVQPHPQYVELDIKWNFDKFV